MNHVEGRRGKMAEREGGSDHGYYGNGGNRLSARYGGDGTGGHMDHERCEITPYRNRPTQEPAIPDH